MSSISDGYNLVLFCHSAKQPITRATKDLLALVSSLLGLKHIRWVATEIDEMAETEKTAF